MMENKNEFSPILVILGMIFATCFTVSNLIAGKMWALSENIAIPASVILFPVTYILADVFTEVYGFKRTRLIIWAGIICNICAVIAYVITIDMPYPAFWIDQDAFGIVLGMAPRVLLASFIAYLIGEFSNSIIMSRLKIITKGKKLWLRTIGSSIVGEAFDSLLFITIAFAGTVSTGQIVTMILYQYLFKLAFEILFTPFTYWITGTLKKKEKIDTFDYDEKYRVFGIF